MNSPSPSTFPAVRGNSPRALTSAPLFATVAAPAVPEFLRMPPPAGFEPFSGLRRGLLYELLREGKVRSVCLRKPGAQRGVRLIEAASLFGYLRKLCDEQNRRRGRVGLAAEKQEACGPSRGSAS